MSIFGPARPEWVGRMLSVLRIVSAFIFLLHGTQKLFDWPIASRSPVELMSQTGLAGVLETFGGLLLLIGLFTRPVAFLLSGEMAVAYFQVHFPRGFFPIANGGDNAALFCFLFLYFVFAGAGPWSVDHLIHARTSVGSRRVDLEDR
jgi:putative oxidoreductase